MDRATYNNIRLKAYYWEKQVLRGRDDPTAVELFTHYTEQFEKAKEEMEKARTAKRLQKQEAAAEAQKVWRKNVRRRITSSKGYDTWTLNALNKSLTNWNPSTEVVFD